MWKWQEVQKERNVILLNAIVDIVGFNKGKNWNDFRREMSDDHIRELYRVVGWLWPTNTDIIPLLESRRNDPMIVDQELPDNGELSIMRNGANLELGLYIGQLTGSYLYTDRVE